MTSVQKEEFNFVVGFVIEGGRLVNGQTVFNQDKTVRLGINHNEQITLARCAKILDVARKLSGRDLMMIKIRYSTYSKTPGNECGDFAETCFVDKSYNYDVRTNSLTIYDKGEPVYANDSGAVCRDQVALYDSL